MWNHGCKTQTRKVHFKGEFPQHLEFSCHLTKPCVVQETANQNYLKCYAKMLKYIYLELTEESHTDLEQHEDD